jgi:hypothetical protein
LVELYQFRNRFFSRTGLWHSERKLFFQVPAELFQDSTGISSSSAIYSVTQRSILNASNPSSQLTAAEAQAHEQVIL